MASDAPGVTTFVVRVRRELSDARRRIRDTARSVSDDGDWLDAVVLAASEVITNAIEYGSGDDVDVTMSIEQGSFVMEVTGSSTGIPYRSTDPVPATSVRGRGLHVVHSIADQVFIEAMGDRVTVRCTFDAPGPIS
jgi:anti-sigma regulatory factor (Ser/Thr protein kinase)